MRRGLFPSGPVGASLAGSERVDSTVLDGSTRIIAHIGYPTLAFKAPLIYNPYFASIGLNAAVVPMGVTAENLTTSFPAIARFSNMHGALVTMPHKVKIVSMLDEVSDAVRIAGSCNAVLRHADGRLIGDMFDGEGFARGLERKGCAIRGARVFIAGAGGVGSAIAATLAARGAARIALIDPDTTVRDSLASRLIRHHPGLSVETGTQTPAGFDIVVNATPLGMRPDDPLPFDAGALDAAMFVGEVVMSQEITPLLAAARARGCRTQVGLDMLYEMIPAYLDFFGFPTTTPDRLRALARVDQGAAPAASG
jgi:shikimate dehydrogenase